MGRAGIDWPMPHLRLRNIDPLLAQARAVRLIDRLTEAVGCERSWFTLELVSTQPLDTGSGQPPQPLVEVLWFDRSPELRKAVASILAEELGQGADCLTTVFLVIGEGNYYENGEAI
jgi:hypothetical protein